MKQLVNKIVKYLRVYFCLIRLDVMEVFVYRLNSLVVGVTPIVWMATMIVFTTVIFRGIRQIGGWSFWEAMLLLGIHELIFLGTWMFFAGNLEEFMTDIRRGTFDKTLLKPVNQRFLVSFNGIDFTSIGSLVNVIALLFVSLIHLSIKTSILGVLLFFVSLISAYLMVYLIYFCLSCLSLFFVDAGAFSDWVMEMTDFDRYPADIYGKYFKFFLFFVLPILFLAYVPTAILLNKLPDYFVGIGILLVIWLYIISTIVWRVGLKRYQSASS